MLLNGVFALEVSDCVNNPYLLVWMAFYCLLLVSLPKDWYRKAANWD